jgi:hypothetical protein
MRSSRARRTLQQTARLVSGAFTQPGLMDDAVLAAHTRVRLRSVAPRVHMYATGKTGATLTLSCVQLQLSRRFCAAPNQPRKSATEGVRAYGCSRATLSLAPSLCQVLAVIAATTAGVVDQLSVSCPHRWWSRGILQPREKQARRRCASASDSTAPLDNPIIADASRRHLCSCAVTQFATEDCRQGSCGWAVEAGGHEWEAIQQ